MLPTNQSLPALTEQQALAHYPSTARCRLSEGQEWLDSLRSETRLTTRFGWRGRVRLCDSAAAAIDGTPSSVVSCYVGWHKPPIHEYLCEAKNLQINFSASMWSQWSRRKPKQPLARRGALRGRCELKKLALPVQWPQETHRKRIFGEDAFLGPGFVAQAEPLRCERRVRHPVLLHTRGDTWNPFHATEELFNNFLTLLVHNVSAADVQLIVADRKREGALFPLWQAAFSPNHRLTRLDDWRSRGAVCFDRLLTAMPHAACKVCNPIGAPAKCGRSPIVSLYADFALRGFGLPPVTSAPPGGGSCGAPVYVTWITRRKKNLSGKMLRGLPPEFEEAALATVPRRASLPGVPASGEGVGGGVGGAPAADVHVRMVDFGTLDVAEQFALARRTSVLVGMHGAALTHQILMAPGGAVVEMNPGGNYHYANFASRAGHMHLVTQGPGRGGRRSPDKVVKDIVTAVEHVMRTRCAPLAASTP